MLFFGIVLAGYVFWRGILPLRTGWRWKGPLSVLLLLTAFKFQLLHLIGGPMFFAPELPPAVLLASAWFFAVLFLFFFLLVAADLARGAVLLVLSVKRRRVPESFRIAGNPVNLILLALAAVLASIGIFCGTKLPVVRERTIPVAGLPAEAEGLVSSAIAPPSPPPATPTELAPL